MNLRKILIIVLLVALAGGSFLLYSSRKRDNSAVVSEADESKFPQTDSLSPKKRVEKPNKPSPLQGEEIVVASQPSNAPAPDAVSENIIPQTEVGRDLARIDELLGEEHYQDALLLCRKWMESSDPNVRNDVAFSLGWMGVRALPELSRMHRMKRH